MSGRRDYIHDLRTKLMFLAERTEKGTWKELERHVRRSTRQQACNPNSPYYSLLGRPHQKALAKAFGFDVEWPEWRDPQRTDRGAGRGIDTAEAFKLRLLQTEQSGEICETQSAVTVHSETHGYSTVVATDRRMSPAYVTSGDRRQPDSPLGPMAQVALELGQTVGPGAHQILVEVSCHRGNIIGSNKRFTVRNATLALDCGRARARRDAIAGVPGGAVVLCNPAGETTFTWSGTEYRLRWDVTAAGAMIGYLWFDVGVVERLCHGDVLRVTISAWTKHIDSDDRSEQAFAIVDQAGNISPIPDDQLTVEQMRLIEHINKLRLPIDNSGCAQLASHELEIVRKE